MDIHCAAGISYLGRVLALGSPVTVFNLPGLGGRGGGDTCILPILVGGSVNRVISEGQRGFAFIDFALVGCDLEWTCIHL